MSENSVENEVVRRRPRWLVPLVAGVCVIALAGGVTGRVIAWRDGNARASADAQSRCECSLAKVDEARKAYAKMVESAGGMKAVKAEQVADALAARRSSPTCSPAGSPAGRAPPPWTPGGCRRGRRNRRHHGPSRMAARTVSRTVPAMARGASASCTPPGSGNAACLPRPARPATRTATPWPRAPTARTGPGSSGGASPSGIRGTRNRRRSGGSRGGDPKRPHQSSGCRTPERTEPGITRTKRRKPPHYKSGTKNRPYHPVSLLQRFKAISESVGASDGGTAKDKFFAEIDGPLDDRYVGLLTDGSNGAYGYSGVEPSEETKKAACQALVEFIY